MDTELTSTKTHPEELASALGFTVAVTGDGRYQWISPCKQYGGREKHANQALAWAECCKTHNLETNNPAHDALSAAFTGY